MLLDTEMLLTLWIYKNFFHTSGAANENIVQNYLNIALLNVF